MNDDMTFQKKHKPVTRKAWKLLRFAPSPLRKRIIRAQFEIPYELPSEYIFKLAETEHEIEEALRIVHDSYAHLGYIDPRPERLHFNAHLGMPTTSVLIIKHGDEVVGTMSLVPDSPMGLPSEATWNLDHVKAESPKIAEVSALAIKRGHKSTRGHLLLTFCKFLYEYGTKSLGLDGVVFAATLEVEPFYTDLLLFQRVVRKTGQSHQLVKGNKSTCCFLDFNKIREQYIKEYGWRDRKKNLFHFFTEFESPNIELNETDVSLHGLLYKKNTAMLKLLKRYRSLAELLSDHDKQRLANWVGDWRKDSARRADTIGWANG